MVLAIYVVAVVLMKFLGDDPDRISPGFQWIYSGLFLAVAVLIGGLILIEDQETELLRAVADAIGAPMPRIDIFSA